jgi:hypothetical protein
LLQNIKNKLNQEDLEAATTKITKSNHEDHEAATTKDKLDRGGTNAGKESRSSQ